MAVVECYETFEGREGSINQKLERTYRRTFVAITNNIEDGPELVRLSLPVPGDVYISSLGTSDMGSYVQDVKLRQDNQDPYTWRCEISYGPNVIEPPPSDNPLLQPTKISFSSRTVNLAVQDDVDGEMIGNSAGEPFDPPLEIEDGRMIIKMVRNLLTFAPATIVTYVGAVNSDIWFGFSPRYVKCLSISAEQMNEKGYLYYQVTVEFEVHPESWTQRVLDRGFREFALDGSLRQILDTLTARPLSKPSLLDGTGFQLEEGEEPVFLEFNIYRELPFATLGIP